MFLHKQKDRNNKNGILHRLFLILISAVMLLGGSVSYGMIDSGDPWKVFSLLLDTDIDETDISLGAEKITYSGQDVFPTVTIRYKDKKLVPEEDYLVEFIDCVNVGEATVKITGIGDYREETLLTYEIVKAENPFRLKTEFLDLLATETLDFNDYIKDEGKGILTCDNKNPELGTIVETTFSPKAAGKATIEFDISGDENYLPKSGTLTIYIKKDQQEIKLAASEFNKTLADEDFDVHATLATGDGKLRYESEDSSVLEVKEDGTVQVKGVGSANINVTADETDLYEKATEQITVTVKPPKISNFDVKAETVNGKLRASWTAIPGIALYQLQCSTDSNFSSGKTMTVSDITGSELIIDGLEDETQYFVRVRAADEYEDQDYFGDWSATGNIVTKEKPKPVVQSTPNRQGGSDGVVGSDDGGEVLVTKTGSCYHNHKCGRGTYYWVSFATAKACGLRACQRCY